MILLISYYYPPELSAGAFRSIGFSKSILNYYKNNSDNLTILTAKEYRHNQKINYEELNNTNSKIKIIRIKVPFKGGGLLKGLVNFFVFLLLDL